MSARDDILAKVRRSLEATENDEIRKKRARSHIEARARHPIPERARDKSDQELHTLFRAQLEGVQAEVIDVDAPSEVPEAISDFLRRNNLPQTVRCGDDTYLGGLPWGEAPTLELVRGPAEDRDKVGLSHAIAGVAETGTLLLASGADNPVTVNFMPETHVVVVRSSDIVGPYEDGFDRLRARFGNGRMPRTVNMISGASRTGDIGGRIVMGAHGPRRLCVVVVRN